MTTETLGQGDHLTERQLRLLIEQAPVAISMFDRDMRYLVASRRWLEDYQLDAAIVGRSLYEVFPEMPERWKAIHRRVLGGEVMKAEQDHFERADRVVQWLRWEMRPWRDIDGEIGGIVIFTEDVTDRRLADEQRQLFVSLAQSSRDFIGMCDAHFRPFFVNAAGLRMVGLGSLDEATRTPVKEFFFPEDQAFIMHEFFPRVQLEGCGEVEIRFRHFVTRKPLWMQYSVFSLTEVTSGQTSGYATVSRNITEYKRAQQQLIEAQHRLQAVMRAAPVGISYSDDPSCEHITGNPALLSQFEVGPDENISASASEPTAVGRQVRFFRDGREIAAHELPLQRAVAEAREIPPMQLEVLLPSGRRWFAEASAAPILGEQAEIIGGVAVTIDITEHLRIEQALRENDRRKDEFLAMLAHELRNPLAPIQNGLHVLQKLDGGDPVSKDRAHSVLTIVERQVAHLTRLVDDLLETARITAGKIELRKQHVDLATVIQQALQLSEPLIQAGKHKISISLDHQPLIVDGDPVRLTQVFANLLNNAAKYTPSGGQIEILTKRDGDQASVSVRDNGIGIKADVLPEVFDLFTQSSRALSHAQGGIGVGLALVRSLVEMHGGQVEARSEGVGCGSEFLVRLPLAVTSSGAEKTEEETTVSSIPATRRVLVVDDDRDVADILAMLLQALGWDVRVVYSGVAGLSAVVEFKPQLAFVDIGMSGMDGYETARQIRKLPGGNNLVLAALSGWGQKDDRRRAIAAGFDHHFLKPIGIDALKKLLASLPISA